jgi:hypothetical protein
MLLLTDGSVMVLSADDNTTWFKLTPDSHGSYVDGTWSVLAQMNIARLYFASEVLQDGRVWVLGGEYTGPFYDENIAPTGEMYDPVNDTWTFVATYPNKPSCSAGGRKLNVTSDVNLTNGSPVVTGIYSTDRLQRGSTWTVTATSPNASSLVGAAVLSVDSPTQVTLNRNSSITAGATLRFRGPVLACFGDDPSILLPGGNILAGDILTNQPSIYSISGNSWSPAGAKVYDDPSDEEGWAVLDDGRILNYDLFESVGLSAPNPTGQGYAELYSPDLNAWSSISPPDGTATGTLPILSSTALGFELGPVMRLQDGRVLVVGANQHTALYTPSTNTWAAGPDMLQTLSNPFGSIPNAKFGADDAPAAELPNGHVITAADAGPNPVTENSSTTAGSPSITVPSTAGFQPFWDVNQVDGKNTAIPAGAFIYSIDSPTQLKLGHFDSSNNVVTLNALATNPDISLVFGGIFNPPVQLFDFDPAANTMTPISSPPGYINVGSFVYRMLMLPTGQLLYNTNMNQLYVYTPDGGPSASVRPVINKVTDNGSGVFTLTGKQLNGQSAGAVYGDDAVMDENYPIVRLTDPSTGNVFYCKSTNWSSVSVGGDGTPETVDFTLNPSVTPGNYTLTVIGAGIASVPVAFNVASTAASTVSAVK